jgi:hypothetical protein
MRTELILSAVLLSVAIGIPAAVLAGDDNYRSNRLNVPQDKWLSPTQITEKLDQKGYKVTEIEVDDGSYEVEMTDKNGVRVDAHVHPETGELAPLATTTRVRLYDVTRL